MKKLLSYTLIIFIFGTLGYLLTIYFIPYIVLYKLKQISKERNIKDNEFFHSPVIDANSRSVVRPNPDFLYSICAYDLSKKNNIKISGIIPDSTYWSIAFYQNNTVNFYVKNDRQFTQKNINLILIPKGISYKSQDNEEVIEAPTQTGVILTRLLIPHRDEKTIKQFQKLQKTFKIGH